MKKLILQSKMTTSAKEAAAQAAQRSGRSQSLDPRDPSELEKRQNKKHMYVCTHMAKPSQGQSTDMHSKAGYSTINNYQQFIDVHRKVPGIKVSQDEMKHNRILEFLSFVPERLDE